MLNYTCNNNINISSSYFAATVFIFVNALLDVSSALKTFKRMSEMEIECIITALVADNQSRCTLQLYINLVHSDYSLQ